MIKIILILLVIFIIYIIIIIRLSLSFINNIIIMIIFSFASLLLLVSLSSYYCCCYYCNCHFAFGVIKATNKTYHVQPNHSLEIYSQFVYNGKIGLILRCPELLAIDMRPMNLRTRSKRRFPMTEDKVLTKRLCRTLQPSGDTETLCKITASESSCSVETYFFYDL